MISRLLPCGSARRSPSWNFFSCLLLRLLFHGRGRVISFLYLLCPYSSLPPVALLAERLAVFSGISARNAVCILSQFPRVLVLVCPVFRAAVVVSSGLTASVTFAAALQEGEFDGVGG